MEPVLVLTPAALRLAGILMLAFVTIETGGMYLVKLVRGRAPATEFQMNFARAGHAHAGVLVILGVLTAVLTDATHLTGVASLVARSGVPVAAILMPAGFFFSSMGTDVHEPNRLIVLVWLGAVALAAGAATLGIGLLTA
ncbi:hypothetical protein [Salsipaludibacter albus]|uniref:hypothetical protein n=1 Tax=Salsipaludibacter albus TaxID=2849650 RepID=UPI001EE4B672|nr:hypothetical protein [Salsipaludibacter albus]MBY5161713.1 hypothetical protein [Salsipaludibacter albus]